MIIIIGGGPSGLIVGNYLKIKNIEFKLFDGGKSLFNTEQLYGLDFNIGQRT